MKIDFFSAATQDGLREWAKWVLHDESALDGTTREHWAWVAYLLRGTPDRPEWFPKGKWATIQVLESELMEEAKREIARS
jgi:hypothetical protein